MSPGRPDHHGRKDSRSRQSHANQNARRGRPEPKVLLALALVAAVVVVLALAVRGCATDNASGQAKADAQQATDDQVAPQPMDGVSFCAVGDNLANENTLAYAAFDVVNTNSNHTYDTWTDSILNAREAWASYPNITVIGSYASKQDRQNVRTVEKNGITIAFLSYSYGQNGCTRSQLPNDYYAVPWDEEAMKEDMARAKQRATLTRSILRVTTPMTWLLQMSCWLTSTTQASGFAPRPASS
jgi:hypothetical protein